MMGHPDLSPECDAKQLEPLLPEDVVNQLLSDYLTTFTVSIHCFALQCCFYSNKLHRDSFNGCSCSDAD